MGERKYRYKQPDGPQQHVEAIFEEISLSPRQKDYKRVETLKDYVHALLDEVKSARHKEQFAKQMDEYNTDAVLTVLGIVSVVLLLSNFSRAGNGDWLDLHRFEIRLCGMILSAIFVGISIERTPFFRRTWAFGFTRLVAWVAFSALLVFCTGKASAMINAIFAVDASALPFTRAIVTGLLIFQYVYPLLIIVVVAVVAHLVYTADWVHHTLLKKDRYEAIPWRSTLFLLLGTSTLVFSARWVNRDFAEVRWPKKIYRLAHVVDFNSSYTCTNLPKGMSVLFLGPQQDRVLVDLGRPQTNELEAFINGEISENVALPDHFPVVPCA